MASTTPLNPSTTETSNYARLCRLLVDVGSCVLRNIFDRICPPADLHTALAHPQNQAKLQTLLKKRVLSASQRCKLYPTLKSSVSSRDFDSSLVLLLLKNIFGVTVPTCDWKNISPVIDATPEADITCLKFHREKVYSHAIAASVDDPTFTLYWNNIKDTFLRIGGDCYKEVINNLTMSSMDADLEEHYQELLREWLKDEDCIADKLHKDESVKRARREEDLEGTIDISEQDSRMEDSEIMCAENRSAMKANDSSTELSIKIPRMCDLPETSSAWSNVELPVDILLLTVEDCEFLSCFLYLKEPFKSYHISTGHVYFGYMGDDQGKKMKIALMRCSKCSDVPGGSLSAAKDAISLLRPKATFSVGACSGLNSREVKLGDVVVSAKLITAAHKTPPSRDIGNLIKHVADGWKAPLQNADEYDAKVHCDGVFLSISDANKDMIGQYPEAVAVEMEGGGVFAAAHDFKTEWVVVKGIKDFANERQSFGEKWKQIACVMASSVVANILNDPVIFQDWPHFSAGTNELPPQDKIDEMGKKLEEKIDGVSERLKGLHEMLDAGRDKGIKLESELRKVPVDVYGHTMEVDRIVKILTDDGTKDVEAVLVSGIPGIGKSTVSIQACHILKGDFGRIIKFCSLRDIQRTQNGRDTKDDEEERVFREILSTCEPGHQATHEYPKHVLLNWCRRLEQDLVLVLDNAEDALEDSLKDSFIHLLTEMRTCSKAKIKFIITSRRTEIGSTGPVLSVEKVPIGSLSEEDSIQVLKEVGRLQTDSNVSAEKLRRVAELCEYIPLALRLASPLLSSDSEYSVDELIVDLEKHPTDTLECEAIMEIAFEKLSEPLRHSLIRLSVFSRSFEKNAAKALLGNRCAQHLMKLKKRCFIQKIGDRYFLHLLIRSYARAIGAEKFLDIWNQGQQAFDEHFLAMIFRNTKTYMRKDECKASFDLFNEERLNYESLLRNVGDEKIRNCDRLRDVVNDCRNIALYVEYCVPVKLYEEFLKGLLRYVQKQNETVHEVEILCLLYHEGRKQGCVEKHAKTLIDRASTLFQENQAAFKKSVPSEVSYLSHYGRYLSQDCKQLDEAHNCLKKTLSMCELYEKETTEWLPDKATILGQMGHGAKFQGRKEEARKCYSQALEFRQVQLGNHILTAFAYKNLADYYLKCEDLPLAKENYMKAIDIMKRLNKAEHKEAIPMYKNMGICFEKSEMFHESRKTYEKGSEVADNTIEGNHKWKVWIQTYLALLLHSKYPNDAAEAVRIAEDVLEMGRDLGMKNWPRKEELEKMSQTH